MGGKHKISLFDAFSFTIPDDKPVLGNQTFNLDLGTIGFDLELNEGTFKGTFGVNFEKDEDGKFGVEEFKKFKETVNDTKAKILAGASTAIIHDTLRQKGYGNFSNVTVKSDWEPTAAICGYMEGKVVDGKLIPIEGGIIVKAALEYSYEGQAFVVVVPVYYSIGAGGEISVSAGVKGMVVGDGYKPMFTGNFKFAPYFEIGGGLGVVYLGQVGARGRATLSFDIALDHNYQKVDLTGQAYFEIRALTFKLYEKEIASGTWNIYETGREQGVSLMSISDNTYDSIDISTTITPEDRSYANNPTEWLGENQGVSLMSTDYTNKELRVLQTNSYPDAKPQIMNADGKKVMLWISDNTSRSAANKSMLVYSVYIDEYDTWSNPKAVMDNGMADYYPVVNGSYVVWQKAIVTFDETVTLADAAKNTEIYITKFNGTGFDAPIRLTENKIVDTQPKLAVSGDAVTVVWAQNSDNNILGYTGTNSIYQRTLINGTWSKTELVAGGLNTIAHMSVGYMNSVPVVAYALDVDNNLNTINDREIFIVRNGVSEQITDNDVIDSNPIIKNINGVPALFWYSDNNVYYMTDLDNKVINTVSADGIGNLTDDYSIMSNGNNTAILWTTVQDGISEVHGALYDGSQWSNDVTITQTGQVAKYPNGIIDENGKLLIGFNRIQNVKYGDYYKDGQADLCVMGVTPSYDISISNAYINGDIAPNTEVPVYFTVTNSGELPIKNISASIVGVDSKENTQIDFEQILQPGESVELKGIYKIGNKVNAGNVKVVISIKTGAEYNKGNNTVIIPIGMSDAEITDISDKADGDKHKIYVTVKNSGYTDAENLNVMIRKDSSIGDIVSEQTIDLLSAQEEKIVTFDVNANELPTDNEFVILTGMVETESDEVSKGNNHQTFVIAKGGNITVKNYYSINDVKLEDTFGNELTALPLNTNYVVSVDVEKLQRRTVNDSIIVAAYDSNGKLLSLGSDTMVFADGDSNTFKVTLPGTTTEIDYIKTFIWTNMLSLMPLATMHTFDVSALSSNYPYIIQSISITNEIGTALDAAPTNESFIVDVEVLKNQTRDSRDYLIVSVYDTDGALLSTDYVYTKLTEGVTYSFGFNISAQTKEIGTIKACVSSSLGSTEYLSKEKVWE